MNEDENIIHRQELRKWLYDHASELLKLYWDYTDCVGDEGKLCDKNGDHLLLDKSNPRSLIQEWDVNEEG